MATERTSLLRKRAARLAAAQALYAQALTQKQSSAGDMVNEITHSWKESKTNEAGDLPFATQPDNALLTKVLEAALAHRATIEPAIDALILPQWKKSRMSTPLLSTLRAFAAEALAFPQKPRAMLVEEYTEIAAQLVTDEELAYAHKGFNLLLDALQQPPHA